ncbi:MAG TPA: secretin and TonB N-terminal domain-containing protein [Halanaerobiales bacterium]|nr:secretin and TonB N-terminal domain-containing protein [Halanaerobiales bacterium]
MRLRGNYNWSIIIKAAIIFLFIFMIITLNGIVFAGEKEPDDPVSNPEILDPQNMVTLTVRGADIKDVLVMLTEQCGINLVPDETVQGQITIDLRDVDIQEALRTLTIAYGYRFDKIAGNIYLVSSEGYTPPAEIAYQDGKLTLKAENGDIREIINEIASLSGINIIMDNQVQGKVSANLVNVPLEIGLVSFLQANGFALSKSNDIYRILIAGGTSPANLAISVVDGLVSIDVQQADLSEVLRTISRLGDLNMVLFSGVRDVVDLKLDGVPIEEVIDIILSGTRFTYRYIEGVYLVGDKSTGSPASALLTTNELIPLEYLQAETLPQLLPNNFPVSNVKVIKEQNALLVNGTQSEIEFLKEYIAQIDTRIPQIVVDALIVEFSRNRNESPGIRLGMTYDDDEETVLFDSALGRLTYKSILKLPDDFYLRINYLVDQGEATVKARPNITTMNGQQARIDVGTVQYYKVVDSDGDNDQTRYQSINAGVILEVTPWVSSSGEITLKLNPSVSNIGGAATEGPPQISRREVNTTVRVRDGQTIVIGGLIQDVGSTSQSKVPILGDIPYIGALFRSDNSNVNQTEMVIYITPRVLEEEEEDVKVEMEEMLERVKGVNLEGE